MASQTPKPEAQPQSSAPSDAPEVPDLDAVTQLQTCLDQYLVQLYASIRYVSTRHPHSAPIEPLSLPPSQTQSTSISASITNSASTSINGGPNSLPSTQTAPSLHASQPTTASQLPPSSSTSTTHPTRYITFTDPQHDPTDTTLPPHVPTPSADKDKDVTAPEPVSPSHQPLPAPEFQSAIRELSQDLVAKQKQIEGLIGRLPAEGGEGKERERQEERLRELMGELEGLRVELGGARERRERAVRRVDGVMGVWGRRGEMGRV